MPQQSDIARLFFYDLAEPSGTNLNSRELSRTKWNYVKPSGTKRNNGTKWN